MVQKHTRTPDLSTVALTVSTSSSAGKSCHPDHLPLSFANLPHGPKSIQQMTPSNTSYDLPSDAPSSVLREDGIEYGFIGKLQGLKYEPSGANRVERDSLPKAARRAHAEACGKQTGRKASPKGERGGANQYRRDITDRASLEKNFREKFEALNRVRLTEADF